MATSDPSAPSPEDEINASRAPLLAHLEELRKRLIRASAAVLIGFFLAFIFSTPLLKIMIEPFAAAAVFAKSAALAKAAAATKAGASAKAALELKVATQLGQASLQTTGALENFVTRVKLAFFLGFCFAFPVVAYEVYGFIAPGLYKREKSAVVPYLVLSPILFAAGGALVYFVIIPGVLRLAFSQQIAGAASINFIPRLGEYYNLLTALIFAFGIAFQMPLVLNFLGQLGLVNARMLRKGRRYGIFACVIVAAIVTPPDPISQMSLAIPLCLLYEAGVIAVAFNDRRRARARTHTQTPSPP